MPEMTRKLILLAAFACLALAPPAGAAVPRTGRYLVVGRDGKVVPLRGTRPAVAAVRRRRGVAAVTPEYTRELRLAPSDPALSTPETEFGGIPGGGPVEWWLQREGFP